VINDSNGKRYDQKGKFCPNKKETKDLINPEETSDADYFSFFNSMMQ
jgi:hypothetical protein